MTELVFVYGTLMDARIRHRILGHDCIAYSDVLKGYCRQQIEIEGIMYPILAECLENASISGLIFYTNDEGLQRLDDYETAAYGRKRVVLESGLQAWVYVKP